MLRFDGTPIELGVLATNVEGLEALIKSLTHKEHVEEDVFTEGGSKVILLPEDSEILSVNIYDSVTGQECVAEYGISKTSSNVSLTISVGNGVFTNALAIKVIYL